VVTVSESTCPGCRLRLPVGPRGREPGYYNASPECMLLYTEVLGTEFGDAVLFGRVHQLTVDTYAVQHAGAAHKDKSVAVHLVGLELMLERGRAPTDVAPLLQRLAAAVETWPHFEPPSTGASTTVFDVAWADGHDAHVAAVRAWAEEVWRTWAPHHGGVRELVAAHLATD